MRSLLICLAVSGFTARWLRGTLAVLTAIALCLTHIGLAAPPAVDSPEPAATPDGEDTPIEFHGPDIHPGYPDVFHVGYVFQRSALSPDGQYGVIYPHRFIGDDPGEDFVVEVKTSQVLGVLETEEPYFAGKNHGSLSAHWSPDSSAALVENGGKWMPRSLTLIEIKNGKVTRQTQLLSALDKMFAPAITKAEHSRAGSDGVDELSIEKVSWKTRNGLQLEISCDGTTNPKDFAEQSHWSGSLLATWSVSQRKFVAQKVTQHSFRKAEREE